jgi:hypothetical protein
MQKCGSRPGRALSLLASRCVALAFATTVAAAPSVLSAQAAQPQPKPAPAKPAAPKTVPPKPAPGRSPARPAAGENSAALPEARTIIDRHIAAVGGREAILAHSSSHSVGTMIIVGSGIAGAVDIYGAKPNKTLTKINLGGIGEMYEGFDGTVGWGVNPVTGAMLAQGKELEEKRFDAAFYGDLQETGRYASMKTVERTTFDGHLCYKVSLVKKDGSEDFDYYDVETGLKAGLTGMREMQQMGPAAVTAIQSDYKKFGGVLVPTTMKQLAMGVQQVITITSVEFDTVPPATFEPPVQIKALVK